MLPLIIKKSLKAVQNFPRLSNSSTSHKKCVHLISHLIGHMDVVSQRVMYSAGKRRFYLPTTQQIAKRAGLNYWTVRKLLRELRYLGLVERRASKVYAQKKHGTMHYRRDAFSLKFTQKFFELLKVDLKLLGQAALYGARKTKKIVGRAKMQPKRTINDGARVLRQSVNEFIATGQLKSSYDFVAQALKTKQIDFKILKEAFPGAVELYTRRLNVA